MLQEIIATVKAADEVVAEIASRFDQGDAADDLIERLTALVAEVQLLAMNAGQKLPASLQVEIARLLGSVQSAVAAGEQWMTRAGPQRETQAVRARVHRAYRLPPRTG